MDSEFIKSIKEEDYINKLDISLLEEFSDESMSEEEGNKDWFVYIYKVKLGRLKKYYLNSYDTHQYLEDKNNTVEYIKIRTDTPEFKSACHNSKYKRLELKKIKEDFKKAILINC